MKINKTKSRKVVVSTGTIRPGTCLMGRFPIPVYDGSKLVSAGDKRTDSEGNVYMMVYTPGMGHCLVNLETGVGTNILVPGTTYGHITIEDYRTVEMEVNEV